jgi:hypothetical protein
MPNFRCYFMDASGHIILPADIDAEDLETAKHRAFDIMCSEETVRSSSIGGMEIWQDKIRVYPEGATAL